MTRREMREQRAVERDQRLASPNRTFWNDGTEPSDDDEQATTNGAPTMPEETTLATGDTGATRPVGRREARRRFRDRMGALSPDCVALDVEPGAGSGTDIDRVVIAPTGLWIIGRDDHKGRVGFRPGRRGAEAVLVVGTQELGEAIAGLREQALRTYRLLGGAPVELFHPALCLSRAQWTSEREPLGVDGVWVAGTEHLASMVGAPGVLDRSAIERLARILTQRVVAADER